MAFGKFGLLLGAALVSLPLAANAGPNQSISSDGSEAGAVKVGNARVSHSYVGDSSGELSALSSDKSAVMSADEIALLAVAKPMIGPGSGESVIGADTRRQVTNTKKFPYRAIAEILFNGGYLCTGWFISEDTIATAGHCVYDPGVGFYPTGSYTVYPGANGSSTPYGSCTANTLYTVKGWANKGSDKYDYGAIKLNCTTGKTTGWFGFYWTKGSLKGKRVTISGYPGDKPLGTQWKGTGKITVSQKLNIFYQIDTYGGQSGSPIFSKRKNCGTCSMGIHAYGTGGSGPSANNNHGTRITKAVFKNLRKWRK